MVERLIVDQAGEGSSPSHPANIKQMGHGDIRFY